MMNRFDLLSELSKKLVDNRDIVISPLGYTSREWYGINDRKENFYFLGSMGMPISFGLGVALSTDRNVIVLEGDGSCLMNLGALSTVGKLLPKNLKILIMDNESYSSTGGQLSATATNTNLSEVAKGCGIKDSMEISDYSDLDFILGDLFKSGTKLRAFKINNQKGNTPRIDISSVDIKTRFKKFLKEEVYA
ncbi:thiamine pyrophosphate-dependent enzyme [Priestia megaterium]|uniref:thiamine pyrophosphate-dependent enzyme n=1 Tax=Priestia megaterium TaxID=1404 RepID=UPI002079B8F1|nr:thiamine pyrophosphate-dependent enzyme [Priestia megaterium]USL45555.1 thiamine pyrophosphate-dependent enzyme [Priestia megaterium]